MCACLHWLASVAIQMETNESSALKGNLRQAREELIQNSSLKGGDFLKAWTTKADQFLGQIFLNACEGDTKGIALVAVGGYGRGDLAPMSDLDVTLVHGKRKQIKEIADAIWYPLWDESIKVDHSVRSVKEALTVAKNDLKAALGLLDARLIIGDQSVFDELKESAIKSWRQNSATFLPEISALIKARIVESGELAFLLEPDIKESHGGLRDLTILKALAKMDVSDELSLDLSELIQSEEVLTNVRVELHRGGTRPVDRLLLQEQDKIALSLNYQDADKLMGEVSDAGRKIAWSLDTYCNLITNKYGKKIKNTPPREIEQGIFIDKNEVRTDLDNPEIKDFSLIFRCASVAGELDLPISGATLDYFAKYLPKEVVWNEAVLQAFVRLLGLSHEALTPLEALDQKEILVKFLPIWMTVRNKPQRNAYHRFTVDRHLMETACQAAKLVRSVSRPDLLLIGAIFHDIGKGSPGDHTEAGIPIVKEYAKRMTLADEDGEILAELVRHHLLLPDTATRRDLDDPKTIDKTAEAVGSTLVLDLLEALTEADSKATGPAAWGNWKAHLVSELASRTRRKLHGDDYVPPRSDEILGNYQEARAKGTLSVFCDKSSVSVVAPDAPGLLANVAGTLALHGFEVLRATVVEDTSGMVVDVFEVHNQFGREPNQEKLFADLTQVLQGSLDLESRLANRSANYASHRRALSAKPAEPKVLVDNDASASATIVEVRAPDAPGLLYKITSTLVSNNIEVRAALVSTLGHEVVDVFYVTDRNSNKISDPKDILQLETSILARIQDPI